MNASGASARYERLVGVCRKFDLVLVYLFGSRAKDGLALLRGETFSASRSDLDVGIVTNCPLPAPAQRAQMFSELHNDLQEVFDPLRLDLSLLEENHSVFQFEAVKGICIYARDESVRDRYEMDIMRRAADFRPVLEVFLREVLEEGRSMLNALLIEQRLALITGYIQEMEKIAGSGEDDFVRDRILSAAAESYLRRSLEAIFDIGRRILSKSGATELAGEFKGIARGLVECGVVGDELGRTLVQMAGYRNRLVHLYNQVTEPELYAIVSNNLADLHAFVKAVRDYAAEHRGDRPGGTGS